MISFQKRFLFVHIPKTAGNAIQNLLRKYSEDRIVARGNQDGIERFEVSSPGRDLVKHSTLADYQRELGDGTLDQMFKFACVRNPWDRMISYWFSPHRGEQPWHPGKFRKFVTKEVRPIREYLALPENKGASVFDNVDFILRYEHLQDDYDHACRKLGLPVTKLPVRNRSARGRAAEYYDDKLSSFISETFADEIERFGYSRP